MRGSFTLGKILGIPVQLHSSWFLIAALITWSLAGGYFPQEYPGWAAATYWVVGGVTAVLFFASVLLHELGHSVLALREKVPVRGITLFIFGGVAQIGREPETAGAEFRIAIAGPITSLALAGASSLMGGVLSGMETLAAPLAYLARINLMLAAFNLIPGFPLDGGRVLRSVLWKLGGNFRTATRWATRVGRLVAYGFILVGVGQMFLGSFLNGLWTAFIGWFLNNAAESSYQQVVLRDTLSGVTARDVMTQQCITVSRDAQVDSLVNDQVLGLGHRCFFVAENGDLEGLITLHNLKAVPPNRRGQMTARQVMTPVTAVFAAEPDEDVLTLLQRMDEANVNQVPVIDQGQLLGMVTRENMLHYIRLRSDLSV